MGTREKSPTDLDVALLVFEMRYGDLQDIGRTLRDMAKPHDGEVLWDLSDDRDWAEMLYAWAESVVSDRQIGGE